MSKKYSSAKKHEPVDPDVKIPAAIRAASARSDALHKAAYQTPEESPNAAEGNSGEGGDGAATVEVTHDAAQGENNGGEVRQPKEAEPKKEDVSAPPAQVQAEKRENGNPAPSAQDWEHKYNSLKGRFEQQENTIRSLNDRLASMDSLLARMESNPPAPKPTQQPPSELTFKPISQEDKETFGDEFIDVAQRAALEKVSPEIARLNRTIADLQAKLGSFDSSIKQRDQKTVYQHMDAELPNWREINRDQNFIAWTNLPDPFSGVTRGNMLRDAFNKGDGPRVLRFFQGFLNDEAATDPANRVQPDKPLPNGKGKVPLEQFAAPGRAKAPAATPDIAPGEKETITRAQIANFYRLKNQGHWRGNEAEMNALEQRIFQAQAEGRITD